MIWNLIRRVSSKPDGALFPAQRSPAPPLPSAPTPRRARRAVCPAPGGSSGLASAPPRAAAARPFRRGAFTAAGPPALSPSSRARTLRSPPRPLRGAGSEKPQPGKAPKSLARSFPKSRRPVGAAHIWSNRSQATSFLHRNHTGKSGSLSICGNNKTQLWKRCL